MLWQLGSPPAPSGGRLRWVDAVLSGGSDLTLVVFVLLVAFLFFGGIPGIGAFTVRARWRRFRARMVAGSLRPFVQYSDLLARREGGDSPVGTFRAFGNLEALEGSHRIWINTGRFTVGADLEGVQVYVLPSFSAPLSGSAVERLEQSVPDEEPTMVPWERIYSLPAGTQVFVEGTLFSEDGQAVFRTQPKYPLLVVIYDGHRRTILQRAIWSGRQKNEYWNQFTLASLLTGAFLLVLLAYVFLRVRGSGLPALVALSLALFPVAILLPPGVLLYFLYRHLWKRARLLRAERDLLRLPVRYFEDWGRAPDAQARETVSCLPSGERYVGTREFRWLINGPLVIRGSRLIERASRLNQPYWLFGAEADRARPAALRTPEDPMAELVLVLGDPEDLARNCSRTARTYELVSAATFFAGVSVNLLLLLAAWHLILR
ncbi:MAG: hypothetical protein JW820_03460 [Spirochaetales bacterium]|nr:hypothetical protein [Spirochaetales bacterium]